MSYFFPPTLAFSTSLLSGATSPISTLATITPLVLVLLLVAPPLDWVSVGERELLRLEGRSNTWILLTKGVWLERSNSISSRLSEREREGGGEKEWSYTSWHKRNNKYISKHYMHIYTLGMCVHKLNGIKLSLINKTEVLCDYMYLFHEELLLVAVAQCNP